MTKIETPDADAQAQALADDIAARRAARQPVPFGTTVQKLAYPERAGYHRHWFNDTSDRILAAEAGGYTFVKDAKGTKVKRTVGVDTTGQPLAAYLMEIPEVLWEEDMAEQQRRVNEVDETIRKRAMLSKEQSEAEDDTFYVPGDRKAAVTQKHTMARISR